MYVVRVQYVVRGMEYKVDSPSPSVSSLGLAASVQACIRLSPGQLRGGGGC